MYRLNKRKKCSLESSFRKKSLTSFGDFSRPITKNVEEDISGFSSSSSEDDLEYGKEALDRPSLQPSYLEVNKIEESQKIAWSSDSEKDDENISMDLVEDPDSNNCSSAVNDQKSSKKVNISIDDYNSDEDISQVESQSSSAAVNPSVSTITQESIRELSPSPIPNNKLVAVTETDIFGQGVEDEEMEHEGHDSAKKAKKSVKGGLVERLNKLISREKSDAAFWKHDTKSKDNQEELLRVEVMSIKQSHSLSALHCMISSNGLELYLLLSPADVKKFKVKECSILEIHPPWKKLYCMKSKAVVMFCAYHIKILANSVNGNITKAEKETMDFFTKQASEGQQAGMDGSSLLEITTHSRHEDIDSPKRNISIIEALEESGNNGSISFVARIQRVFCKYAQIENKFKGNQKFKDQLVSENPKEYGLKFSILVQDNVGMLSEIIISEYLTSSKKMKSVLETGEGLVFEFKNLRFSKRISHRRYLSYESIINYFLPSKEEREECCSQLEDSDSQRSVYNIPHCSYLFDTDDDYSDFDLFEMNKEFSIHYKDPFVINDCSDICFQNKRVSMYCKLIAIVPDTTNGNHCDIPNSAILLYVANLRGNNTTVVIKKTKSCYLPDFITKLMEDKTQEMCLFLKDLRANDEILVADGYSRIFLMTDASSSTNIESTLFTTTEISGDNTFVVPTVEHLKEISKEGDIVSLTGVVYDVKVEESKEMNSASNTTQEERVTEESRKSANQLLSTCKVNVYLKTKQLPKDDVICTLSNTTAIEYLPSTLQQVSFNMVDWSLIVGKTITPLLCHVISIEETLRSKSKTINVLELETFCKFKIS